MAGEETPPHLLSAGSLCSSVTHCKPGLSVQCLLGNAVFTPPLGPSLTLKVTPTLCFNKCLAYMGSRQFLKETLFKSFRGGKHLAETKPELFLRTTLLPQDKLDLCCTLQQREAQH